MYFPLISKLKEKVLGFRLVAKILRPVLSMLESIIQTRKIKSNSIQFCIEYLVLFDFICFQLSCFYGLSLLVLSIRYHDDVITLT